MAICAVLGMVLCTIFMWIARAWGWNGVIPPATGPGGDWIAGVGMEEELDD